MWKLTFRIFYFGLNYLIFKSVKFKFESHEKMLSHNKLKDIKNYKFFYLSVTECRV